MGTERTSLAVSAVNPQPRVGPHPTSHHAHTALRCKLTPSLGLALLSSLNLFFTFDGSVGPGPLPHHSHHGGHVGHSAGERCVGTIVVGHTVGVCCCVVLRRLRLLVVAVHGLNACPFCGGGWLGWLDTTPGACLWVCMICAVGGSQESLAEHRVPGASHNMCCDQLSMSCRSECVAVPTLLITFSCVPHLPLFSLLMNCSLAVVLLLWWPNSGATAAHPARRQLTRTTTCPSFPPAPQLKAWAATSAWHATTRRQAWCVFVFCFGANTPYCVNCSAGSTLCCRCAKLGLPWFSLLVVFNVVHHEAAGRLGQGNTKRHSTVTLKHNVTFCIWLEHSCLGNVYGCLACSAPMMQQHFVMLNVYGMIQVAVAQTYFCCASRSILYSSLLACCNARFVSPAAAARWFCHVMTSDRLESSGSDWVSSWDSLRYLQCCSTIWCYFLSMACTRSVDGAQPIGKKQPEGSQACRL